MSTAITLITPDVYTTFDKMANDIVRSGFTKLTEFQVKYIFLKGYELGVSPLQALDGINNIQGKPTCSPQFMLGLINRSGQVEDIAIDSNDQRCIVTMTRKGRSPHTEMFSLADAKAMQLEGKDNWRKQPKTMMKWRAVAACARVVYPDVVQGLYTPEEMGADVNVTDDGEMVVVSKVSEPPVARIPETVPVTQEPPASASTPPVVVSSAKVVETAQGEAVDAEKQWTAYEAANFATYWQKQGLTQGDLFKALGVKDKLSEWTKSRIAADAAVSAMLPPVQEGA